MFKRSLQRILAKPGWGLWLLCLLAYGLRCYFADKKSIGFDEWITYTISLGIPHPESSALFNPKAVVNAAYFKQALQQLPQQSTGALSGIFKALESDLNLPGYFMGMSLWLRQGLPFSALMLRLPSVILSVACLPTFIALGQRLQAKQSGWIASILFSVMPYALFYGSDARPYSLIILLSLLGSLAILNLLQTHTPNWRHWLAVLLCFWLGLSTHYFFILTALFWSVLLLTRRDQLRPFWWWMTGLWLPPLLLAASLLSHQLMKLESMNPLKATISVESLASYLYRGLFSVFFLYSPTLDWVTLSFSLVLMAGLLIWLYGLWHHRQAALQVPIVSFCGVWLLVNLVGMMAISIVFQSRLLEVPRYWSFMLPAMYLLAGYWPGQMTLKTRAIQLLVWLMPLSLIGIRFYKEQGYADFNYRLVSQVIQVNSQPKDLTLTLSGFPTALALAYYLPDDTPMATQFTPSYAQSGNERLAKLLNGVQRVWFCASFNQFPKQTYLQLLEVLTHQQGFRPHLPPLITKPQPLVLVLADREKSESNGPPKDERL